MSSTRPLALPNLEVNISAHAAQQRRSTSSMKLATVLAVYVSFLSVVPGCWCLYSTRPTIHIVSRADPPIPVVAGSYEVSEVGDYDYDYTSERRDVSRVRLYVIEEPNFGCPGYNMSNITRILPPRDFVLMVPNLGANSPCLEFFKAQTASRLGASGLIFQYDRTDVQGGWLGKRPPKTPQLSGITVVTMELRYNPAIAYRPGVEPAYLTVSITAHLNQFQTSQTFYFIVFAFCILMLLSCLWFVMSYIKRCHYNVQRRRRRVRGVNFGPFRNLNLPPLLSLHR